MECFNTPKKPNFCELRETHPEGWAYMHIINKKTGRLRTFGLDIDTLEWNGQEDDVLEDYTNKDLPDPEPFCIIQEERLADFALLNLKDHLRTTDFEDFGGQSFSGNLLYEHPEYEAVLSFEYEE